MRPESEIVIRANFDLAHSYPSNSLVPKYIDFGAMGLIIVTLHLILRNQEVLRSSIQFRGD